MTGPKVQVLLCWEVHQWMSGLAAAAAAALSACLAVAEEPVPVEEAADHTSPVEVVARMLRKVKAAVRRRDWEQPVSAAAYHQAR